MKQFIQVGDVSDIQALIHKGLEYKQDPFMDKMLGANKRVGLLFLNPSLRTRLSTQVAAQNLGMDAVVFNVDKEGWALEFAEGAIMNGTTVEHVKDAAPVLGQYFDILCIRTFPGLQNRDEDYAEKIINQFIKYGKDQKFPFFSDDVKIEKFRKEYTADHIAGLTMKYLLPAYEEGEETLRGYLKVEGDRLRMLGAMSGVDENIIKFQ